VGRATARALLAHFGSPQAMFDASAATLRKLCGEAEAAALARPPEVFAERLAAARAWIAGDARHVVTLGDPRYPQRLLHTADPPLLLFVQGDPQARSAPSVAIVGSRSPTAQGRDNARSFAAALSRAQFSIVSGMAIGIDGAAHKGALDAGGLTVAVLGTGPDRVYPRGHRELAHRIAVRGALVSEFSPGTPALPPNFPVRNRIIAGLSLGTLVVEAAVPSGSLITARLALEAGREVFAIPGSIHSPLARGCHELIRQGATLVESPAEIVAELAPIQARLPLAAAAAQRAAPDALLDALGADPVSLDALIDRTGIPAPELSAKLLVLELDGAVARLPGGLYQRRFTG
jgi:DNA processing protein